MYKYPASTCKLVASSVRKIARGTVTTISISRGYVYAAGEKAKGGGIDLIAVSLEETDHSSAQRTRY